MTTTIELREQIKELQEKEMDMHNKVEFIGNDFQEWVENYYRSSNRELDFNYRQDSRIKYMALERKYSSPFDITHGLFRVCTKISLGRLPQNSFEDLILHCKWNNTRFKPEEWNFIFTQFEYKDDEFFIAFMSWKPIVLAMDIEDRKCCVCLSYYNKSIIPKKFRNCQHYSCKKCYTTLPKGVDKYKHCAICRTSEKPN